MQQRVMPDIAAFPRVVLLSVGQRMMRVLRLKLLLPEQK
jgi:hypothetical protein